MADQRRIGLARTMASRMKRNSYTQGSRRKYFFGYPTDGKDGYSDCSSSVRESVRRILNFDIGSNTPAQVNNNKTLEWIEFANGKRYPTVQLEPGDLLYFKGSDKSRPYQVGHVEMVAEDTGYLLGHGSGVGPRKIRLRDYCDSRYKAGRGLIGVKRIVLPGKVPDPPEGISSVGKRLLRRTSPMMKGEDIRKLQGLLFELGYDCDGIDGYYGINTEDAVRAFQFACKLLADGEYGPMTHTALKAALDAGDLEQEEDAPDDKPRMLIATGDVWIRTLPSTSGGKTAVLHKDDTIERAGEDTENWYGVLYNGKQRYVSRKYTKEVL
jgi:hypothetical protein